MARSSCTARGNGEDKVHSDLRNTSSERLNVVLPAGLVASAGSGQFGGFQSMGLGVPTDNAGSFGEFRPRPAASSRAGLTASPASIPRSPSLPVRRSNSTCRPSA